MLRMDPSATNSITEFAIVVAGFTGLVFALERTDGPINPFVKFRTVTMLFYSFSAAFGSVLQYQNQENARPDHWRLLRRPCVAAGLVRNPVLPPADCPVTRVAARREPEDLSRRRFVPFWPTTHISSESCSTQESGCSPMAMENAPIGFACGCGALIMMSFSTWC